MGEQMSFQVSVFIFFRLLFNWQVMSDSSWLHGLQHARLPCSSLSPGVCPSSCLLREWCHPTISSSVFIFSFCLQSFPASGSFSMSWLFASDGQSTGASASASILPMNIQGWFPLRLTGLISLLSKGLSRVFSSTTVQKHSFLQCSAFFMVQLSQPYVTTGKALTIRTFVGKVMSLLFNILSSFVTAFLPRSNLHLISWLQSQSTGILQPKKRKSVPTSTFSPSICHEVMC